MNINEEHLLTEKNYIKNEGIKKQIIIGSTFNHDMKHVIGWKYKNNGKYKKTAAFSIDAAGVVYKHFEPKYQSEYFKELELNNKSIVILLDNDGWLIKDDKKNRFISWKGDIYKQPEIVFEKKWRGYSYWAPYSKKQFESLIELVSYLCDEFYIPKIAMPYNIWVEDLSDVNGVIYKSNIEKHYMDLNPSFNFQDFKDKLELNYERNY